MAWAEINGYAASAAVLATFLMSTMIPLRSAALVSNVLFISYGYFGNILPVLILHAILFPINLHRLIQCRRLIEDVRKAQCDEIPMNSLLPYMKKRSFSAGEFLVRKGEQADRLYYLSEGELEITDYGKKLGPGAIVGEIGVFASKQERTATIQCVTGCSVYELTEGMAKQLFLQDRLFGFWILRLIINRLSENNRHLLQDFKGAGPAPAAERPVV
ncbi:MAG: cyclic nucleotide-binding domain-containing protein [Rhodomicrobium sp.]